MSAWARIVARAAGTPEELAELNEAMQEIQRETLRKAAEKIRRRAESIAGYGDAYRHAADFIDPEEDR